MSTRDLKSCLRLDAADEWLDRNLAPLWYCQMATISKSGPHITPMAFVWTDGEVWINCQTRTQRFVDVQRDPRVSITMDPEDPETRYVEVLGDATLASAVPSLPAETEEIAAVERLFTEKYGVPLALVYDGLHAWVRVTPRKILRITSTIAHRKTEQHLVDAAAAQARNEIHWAIN